MAAPNILSVTSITGKSVSSRPANTATYSILSNASGSNRVYKINSIICSNQNGASTVTANVFYNTAANGAGANNALILFASVPALSTLVVSDKTTSFYLEENASITVSSGTSNGISFLVSYEDIE
jgi:hypothetical protein